MTTTRRPDGRPETPADTRFFDLRESGYLGPIDQDGNKVTGDQAYDDAGRPYSTYSAHPGLMLVDRDWQQSVGRSCPECGEPAVHQPPTDLTPWQAHGRERPWWSHADGSALCPVTGPDGYEPATPVRAQTYSTPHRTPAPASLDQPATDAEFLDACALLAGQLSDLAGQVTDWAEGLAGLHLPQAVLAPLHDAAGLLADSAVQAIKAGQAFRGRFEGARQAAARGLRITGDPS
jgi:hypothetical protein